MMNRSKLKSYAPAARRAFIQAVTDRAHFWGLSEDGIEPAEEKGDVAIIAGRPFPRQVAGQRRKLEERIQRKGFQQVMEAAAYTWFNRFLALRYMELHGYLEHGFRVLSNPNGSVIPEILDHAAQVELPGLDQQKVMELKLDGGKDAELYRMLLTAQCRALHNAMPFLFEKIDDETELLLPDNLLHSDSLLRKLVIEIDEEDWQEVEIIGWLYQFYISEKKAQVIGKVVKSEDIPAATQLFTPNWIVKYMVQNSLGRLWLATYPDSPLRRKMEYYIEPAEQTEEVQVQLKAITPTSLDPESLTFLDPAGGSGHILVEAYDIFKEIYLERGYGSRDFPRLILEKNLYSLDIDDRAAQMAGFALLMKARKDDWRILQNGNPPRLNVMAIRESEGLDAKEIAGNLLDRTTTGISKQGIVELVELFRHGKTFGSLITFPEVLAEKLPALSDIVDAKLRGGDMFAQQAAEVILPFVEQSKILANKYDCVVANPPYMGRKSMTAEVKQFAALHYEEGKPDLFAMFILRCKSFCMRIGRIGLMTPFVWMFLSSYEGIRKQLTEKQAITTLTQPQYHTFFESAAVPICTFVIDNSGLETIGTYFDLTAEYGPEIQARRLLEAIRTPLASYRYMVDCRDFNKIPSSPIAYWTTAKMRDAVHESKSVGDYAVTKQGLITGNNNRFLRRWYEVSVLNTGYLMGSRADAHASGKRWFPCVKGGAFRKWYGNNEFVVDWENDGRRIRSYTDTDGCLLSRPQNLNYYFKEGMSWSTLTIGTFSMRWCPSGSVFESKGSMCFANDSEYSMYLLAFFNTNLVNAFLRASSPTLDYHEGPVARLPLRIESLDTVVELAKEAVKISKIDWDSFESSNEFEIHPLCYKKHYANKLEDSWRLWKEDTDQRINRLKEIEEKNNQRFIDTFSLTDELSCDVQEEQITLAHADREKDCQLLISYAIGCMMGRYSLDQYGLVYAHNGNEGFDESKYKSFPADDDGIIPVMDTDWFPDDVANRFEEFLKVVWSPETLEENLKFIAGSLLPKVGETPRETIRRYLSAQFFKDHLQAYKKRPIYWLFSSGKQRAFECLVYLHRYNEATLSRMRNEYVTPLQGKLAARMDYLANEIDAAATTSARNKLQKQLEILKKKQSELTAFDDLLRHHADQCIPLDLDDGVKVNYGKFGNLLAEVKSITGTDE